MEEGALSSKEEANQISPSTTLAEALAMLQLEHAHMIHEADPNIKVPCCACLFLRCISFAQRVHTSGIHFRRPHLCKNR